MNEVSSVAIAKKRFGQNFLIDPRKSSRMVSALETTDLDTIIEIGPGTGILTKLLLDKGARVIAVEIDRDLIPDLKERFGSNELFKLVENDILDIDPAQLASGGFKLIGNLPYNISGMVIEWMIEHYELIQTAIITVQKEVAERLRSGPGSRDFGSLSVLSQSFFDIARVTNIPPGCFSPKPKVHSTVLRLTPNRKLPEDIQYSKFREFAHGCFSQKRKKLSNSLAASLDIAKNKVVEELTRMGLGENSRAEELTLAEFYVLFKAIY